MLAATAEACVSTSMLLLSVARTTTVFESVFVVPVMLAVIVLSTTVSASDTAIAMDPPTRPTGAATELASTLASISELSVARTEMLVDASSVALSTFAITA